ncbi:MAG TPA: site-specific integrase [Devosia sp.]|jgi:integrase|uniref:tyrosine-type recombinase/integrase n=1 Tax=Devosia sp. TaxID=1871048 RepID=UPI002F92C545
MGTIVSRKRKDGTTGYTAQILIKRGGKIVHRQAQTFDRRGAAAAWIKRRETELAVPGALERENRKDHPLADAIDWYVENSIKEIGRTKAQVLRSIKEYGIAGMPCSTIGSTDIVAFARELGSSGRKPQTVANYLSHLASIFRIGKAGGGFELDYPAMIAAQAVLRHQGTVSKSEKRDRRPTLAELDKILDHFKIRNERRPASGPMVQIIVFAIFSTRRQDEITRIRWDDLQRERGRILVRDMKHPGQKKGNDTWVDLPPEAIRVVEAMPKNKAEIFPYTTDAISAAFTRACQFLGVENLHFHDLRHDGVSRLFEMGFAIPNAAAVSGHRSWSSLQRYTHLEQSGDKYANWPWLEIASTPLSKDEAAL